MTPTEIARKLTKAQREEVKALVMDAMTIRRDYYNAGRFGMLPFKDGALTYERAREQFEADFMAVRAELMKEEG